MKRKVTWKNRILGAITCFAIYGVFAGCGFVEQGRYGLGMFISLISLGYLALFTYVNEDSISDMC